MRTSKNSLRVKVIRNFLTRSQSLSSPQDKILAAKGSQSFISIKDASRNLKNSLSKLKHILNDSDIKNLQDIISVEALRQQRDITGGQAGGLAAGEITSNPISKFGKILQFRLVSIALAQDGIMGKWFKNTREIPDFSNNAMAAILSSSQGLKMLLEESQAYPDLRDAVMEYMQGAGQSLRDEEQSPK